MRINLQRMARRLLFAAGIGACLSLASGYGRGQELPPEAPSTPPAVESGKGAAADTAQGAKGAAEKTKDAAKSDPFDASDATPGVSRDAAGAARDAARTKARNAREAAQDAEDLREGAQEAGRELRQDARNLRAGTRKAAEETREGAHDLRHEPRDGARDAARGLREETLEATDDLRAGAREAGRDAREETRDLREGARDAARNLREDARDERRDLTDDRKIREGRAEFRESRDSFRSKAQIRTESLRAPDLGLWFGRSTGDGLVIADVATTGPIGTLISDFGFRQGDQIVAVNGNRVVREGDFIQYLLADEVLRTEVPVVVMRGGQRTTLYVEPIRLVQQVQTVRHDPLEQFGVILDDRIADRVVVWRVVPRSPAFYAGIRPGDVITTFQGRRVTGPDAFVQIIQRTEPGMIAVEVNRDDRIRQFEVEMAPIAGSTEVRSTLRPDFDDPTIERLSERREDRIEDRRELRLNDGGYVVPRAPVTGPVRRALLPWRR